MQTPGSQITPMSQIVSSPAARMSAAYDKLLAREQSGRDGATIRALGSLLVSFEKVNSEMKVIRRDIRRDLREKRKYHTAETKLLKKEKDVLENLQASVTNFRRILGTAAFAMAGRDLMEGDFGNAGVNALAGTGLLFPEIRDTVITVLGGLGLGRMFFGGGRGGPTGGGRVPITGSTPKGLQGLLSKIPKSGMGKWGALGLTALSLFTLPSLLGGSANAQQTITAESRRERAISGINPEIINERDTNRFSDQLNRFDQILAALTGQKTTTGKKENIGGMKNMPSPSLELTEQQKKDQANEGKVRGKNQWWDWLDMFPNAMVDEDSDQALTEDDYQYKGGRPGWQRFLDPFQIWTKDKEEDNTGSSSKTKPLTEKVPTGKNQWWDFLDWFPNAPATKEELNLSKETQLTNIESLYTKANIERLESLSNVDFGGNIDFVNLGSEDNSFSTPVSTNIGNFAADSKSIYVDPSYKNSPLKTSFRKYYNSSKLMGDD